VMEESKIYGKVFEAINSTFISLIPKNNNPKSFEYFWPISLCNPIYKLITKIIANKLNSILSSVVSKEKFWFLFHE
jgi:hypothetical protein